ncbi:DUF998 domain-containing protein [Jannaschia donghaensis]|uniref:DUF998 domain-containing protein n=1 Tax=Jannaschia donghaensis TaxID=420998 RepID=A0A0M6YLU5_9RHOB|nr:DUF998 domain-containing protein [Jannaschia donghaensis]CTQ51342.1 hypothetical protein JDO7802_03381 [Jannaschia donghaensis]
MARSPHETPDSPGAPLMEHPHILRGMAVIAFAGPVIFAISILIADFVVPDHDWIADTISDLGAGRYEFIVDIGIYAYSATLIACAVAASHAHLGGRGWSLGIYGLIAAGLIVFLIGARNEYGDGDDSTWHIHIYLVLGLYVIFAVIPWSMSAGMAAIRPLAGRIAKGVTIIWVPTAPVFLFMSTEIDGLYERFLGLQTFIFVYALAWTFLCRAHAVKEEYGHS